MVLHPPRTFEAFTTLLRKISEAMDDLGIEHEAGRAYTVTAKGDTVSLRDPNGTVVWTTEVER